MKLTVVTAVPKTFAARSRDALVRCFGSVAKLKTAREHLIYDGASTSGTVVWGYGRGEQCTPTENKED